MRTLKYLSYIKSGGESRVLVLQRLRIRLYHPAKHAPGAEDGRGEAAECTAEHIAAPYDRGRATVPLPESKYYRTSRKDSVGVWVLLTQLILINIRYREHTHSIIQRIERNAYCGRANAKRAAAEDPASSDGAVGHPARATLSSTLAPGAARRACGACSVSRPKRA